MISLRAKIDIRRGAIIIGDNSTITYGCIVLSHDHAATLLGKESKGKVCIGNNVFIGVNSVILPNITIGDNSIIGAGSIVTGNIPAGVLVMGNPAKIVRNLE